MRTALTISAVSHTVLLLWGVVTFVAKPHTAQSVESVAVDVISAKEFSQLTAGSKNAAAVTTPKPFVETVGERRPVDDPTGKIGRKEIADTTGRPPPAPTPKPPTPAEKKPPEPKVSEPKPPEPKPPEPKRDLIAEAIKKDQAKKPEQKKAEGQRAQADPAEDAGRIAVSEPAGDRRDDGNRHRPRRHQEARLDLRAPEHVLEVEGQRDEDNPLGDKGTNRGDNRQCKYRNLEQIDRKQGQGQRGLSAHKQVADRNGSGELNHNVEDGLAVTDAVDPAYQQRECTGAQHGAHQIEAMLRGRGAG